MWHQSSRRTRRSPSFTRTSPTFSNGIQPCSRSKSYSRANSWLRQPRANLKLSEVPPLPSPAEPSNDAAIQRITLLPAVAVAIATSPSWWPPSISLRSQTMPVYTLRRKVRCNHINREAIITIRALIGCPHNSNSNKQLPAQHSGTSSSFNRAICSAETSSRQVAQHPPEPRNKITNLNPTTPKSSSNSINWRGSTSGWSRTYRSLWVSVTPKLSASTCTLMIKTNKLEGLVTHVRAQTWPRWPSRPGAVAVINNTRSKLTSQQAWYCYRPQLRIKLALTIRRLLLTIIHRLRSRWPPQIQLKTAVIKQSSRNPRSFSTKTQRLRSLLNQARQILAGKISTS